MTDSSIETDNSIAYFKKELARRGMTFSEEHFIRYVKSGRTDSVELYLRAGISPNTTLDGESVLAASANNGHKQITKLLLDSGADPIGLVDGLRIGTPTRDAWDRLSSLSGVFTFVSSLLIAGVGWYFTSSYNDRQLELSRTLAQQEQQNKLYQNRVLEMQTVEKMIPHLTKDESSKQAALIAISTLASPDIATRIAQTYGGQGSINALAQLAKSETASTAAPAISALTNIASRETGSDKPAHHALARVLEGKDKAIVKVLVEDNAICNGFVIDGTHGWIVTPQYCFGNQPQGSLFAVQFKDGTKVEIKDRKRSLDGLLSFLKVGDGALPALNLSKKLITFGSAVSQIAFNLGAASNKELGVVLGTVVESGDMSFPSFGRTEKAVTANGLKVKLAAEERALQGTGGGPLLDSEGNVACMTFMGDGLGNEQCVSASVISAAFSKLQSN